MPPNESDFERGWAECPPGHALVQRRQWAYDRGAGLLLAPATFDYAAVSLPREFPSDEWVLDNFTAFVRGEFRDKVEDVTPFPGMPSIAPAGKVESGSTMSYLEACEALVYGGYLDGLLSGVSDDLAVQVHAILSDKRLGNPRNRKNVPASLLGEWLAPLLADRLRIRLVMPAFPFKDQNPFRTTSSRPSHHNRIQFDVP